MAEQSPENRIDWDHVFRWSAILFAIAVALHAADHLRRGMDIVPPAVMVAGHGANRVGRSHREFGVLGQSMGGPRRHSDRLPQRCRVHCSPYAADLGLFQRQLHQCTACCACHLVFVGNRDFRNTR
jgi:hypothetical protein